MNGHCEVYMDGDFSQGAHIFKALALGANMVSGVSWIPGHGLQWGLGGQDEGFDAMGWDNRSQTGRLR